MNIVFGLELKYCVHKIQEHRGHQRTKQLWPRDLVLPIFFLFLLLVSTLLRFPRHPFLLWIHGLCSSFGGFTRGCLSFLSVRVEYICQSILWVTGAGDRYKKLVENTQKWHVIQSNLCTVSAPQETLTTTLMFLPWDYSPIVLSGFTKRMYHSPLWQTNRPGVPWEKAILYRHARDLLWCHEHA